tara:strand:+ start:891 stop:1379 length:489 start_codon:yes stop_codon:yes gene_type:complete
MVSFSRSRKIKTIYSARHDDCWIKIVDYTDKKHGSNFDYDQYVKFYEYIGHKFLPKLHDYTITDENYCKFVMSYIEGKKVKNEDYEKLFDYAFYEIVPNFLQWAMINHPTRVLSKNGNLVGDVKETTFLYHNDMRPQNFLKTDYDNFFLIDIDSMVLIPWDI